MKLSCSIAATSAALLLSHCITMAMALAGEVPTVPDPSTESGPSTITVTDPSTNAALYWWRAFESVPEPTFTIWKSDQSAPDPVVDAFFSRPVLALDLLRHGASQPACIWGTPLAGEGVTTALAYGGHMRQLIRLVLMRARWHARRGENEAATDDLLVSYAAARLQAGSHPLLVEILISCDMQHMTFRTASALAPGLGIEQRLRLASAIDAAPAIPSVADALDQEMANVRVDIQNKLISLNAKPAGSHEGANKRVTIGDSGQSMFVSDADINEFNSVYSEVAARWHDTLRLPLKLRSEALALDLLGEVHLPVLLMPLVKSMREVGQVALGTEVLRLQMLAGLDVLSHASENPMRYPDPLTGMPFRSEVEGKGFRLVAAIPHRVQQLTLLFGLPDTGRQVGASDF